MILLGKYFIFFSLGQDLLIYFSYYGTSISICLSMYYCMFFEKDLSTHHLILPSIKTMRWWGCQSWWLSHSRWQTLREHLLCVTHWLWWPQKPHNLMRCTDAIHPVGSAGKGGTRRKRRLSWDLKLIEGSSEGSEVEIGWSEAGDHPHGQKSRWTETLVVSCGWTR